MSSGRAQAMEPATEARFALAAERLAAVGRMAYARGWALGTSGNFSCVVSRDPLLLAITASGRDKGRLRAEDVLGVDAQGRSNATTGRPSAETPLHLALVAARGAGAVLHTHSIWSTLVSDSHADDGGLAIEGYEMLKGLAGVESHEHRERLPIVENRQDWAAAVPSVLEVLGRHPDNHGLLIRRHGLYTWGRDLEESTRHLEVLEFLLEAVGRERPAR